MTMGPWRPVYPVSIEPGSVDDLLLATYNNLREVGNELEELMHMAEVDGTLSEKDLKRLDKYVVVMKVAFKGVKRTIRKRAEREYGGLTEVENNPLPTPEDVAEFIRGAEALQIGWQGFSDDVQR